MLKSQTMVLGGLETNCYLVWEEKKKEAIVIDPADQGTEIAQIIQEKGLNPKTIVLTHGHFDHCLGAMELKMIYGMKVAASSLDWFLIKDSAKSAKYWLKKDSQPPPLDRIEIDLDSTNKIEIGDESLEVIKTPGHTPGGICLYSQKTEWLFSGDTLFRELRGRTDFSYSSTENIYESICQLMRLPKQTAVFPGHGEATTIGEESKRKKHCA